MKNDDCAFIPCITQMSLTGMCLQAVKVNTVQTLTVQQTRSRSFFPACQWSEHVCAMFLQFVGHWPSKVLQVEGWRSRPANTGKWSGAKVLPKQDEVDDFF